MVVGDGGLTGEETEPAVDTEVFGTLVDTTSLTPPESHFNLSCVFSDEPTGTLAIIGLGFLSEGRRHRRKSLDRRRVRGGVTPTKFVHGGLFSFSGSVFEHTSSGTFECASLD